MKTFYLKLNDFLTVNHFNDFFSHKMLFSLKLLNQSQKGSNYDFNMLKTSFIIIY